MLATTTAENRATEKRTAFVDGTKIGDCAAPQPLSGVSTVDESGSVNGMSHGGYLRMIRPEIMEETLKKA